MSGLGNTAIRQFLTKDGLQKHIEANLALINSPLVLGSTLALGGNVDFNNNSITELNQISFNHGGILKYNYAFLCDRGPTSSTTFTWSIKMVMTIPKDSTFRNHFKYYRAIMWVQPNAGATVGFRGCRLHTPNFSVVGYTNEITEVGHTNYVRKITAWDSIDTDDVALGIQFRRKTGTGTVNGQAGTIEICSDNY